MSMQSVASPAYSFTPPRRNSLTHIPGDEGWPLIGRTLHVLADPKGQVERPAAKYGLVYRSHLFGETSLIAARTRGQRTGAVRPGQAVFLDASAGAGFSDCCFRAD